MTRECDLPVVPTAKRCEGCPWEFRAYKTRQPSCAFIDGDPKYISELITCPDNRLIKQEVTK